MGLQSEYFYICHIKDKWKTKYLHFFFILVFQDYYLIRGWRKALTSPFWPVPFSLCCLFVSQAPIQVPSSFAWHTQTSILLASRICQSCPCSGPAPVPRQHPPCQERSQSGTWEKRPWEGTSESSRWALTKGQGTSSEGRRSHSWRRDAWRTRGCLW